MIKIIIQLKKNIGNKKRSCANIIRANIYYINKIHIISFFFLLTACDDFVDVPLPKNQLTSESVFNDKATAMAALKGIYANMRDGDIPSGLGFQMGLYADELNTVFLSSSFFDHIITPLDGIVSAWWSRTYNLIYTANSVIEGVENSQLISLEDKNQLIGEAMFIRGYLHFLLVDIYGAIPYISTSDYIVNTVVFREAEDIVYNRIIADLVEASNLLGADISSERLQAYDAVVDALLAKVYLYTQQWSLSEEMASNVISKFTIEPDLNQVFLKNASGSIWQFKPRAEGENSRDGRDFIFINSPGAKSVLSESLLNTFEPGDQRKVNWIGTIVNGSNTWRHTFKYKESGVTSSSLEYQVVFRLAEQYLIRAEARAQLGNNIVGAQEDLNVIRNRAGLPNTTATTKSALLDDIFHERQVELFTEQGHRWFDLKRAEKAGEVLAPIKPNWQNRDVLFPIPESEILLNPNLLPQNDGYN